MTLDPDIARYLRRVAALDAPLLEAVTPELARIGYRRGLALRQGDGFQPMTVASVADGSFPGPAGPVAIRTFEPAQRTDVTIVFLHGGGWVIGDLDTHDAQCRSLANATRARVVSVDYRLAPEHPFPAAFDDCLAAVVWASGQWPAEQVAIAGDSAGGALAAACALAARDLPDLPTLAGQLLVYPATDPTRSRPSVDRNATGYGLTRDDMLWFGAQYLTEPWMREDPRVDLLARTDLAGAAPAVVLVAEYDPLHDEGAEYAAHLRDAGVPVTLVEGPGLIHGFYGMVGVSPAAARVVDDAQRAFAARLDPSAD